MPKPTFCVLETPVHAGDALKLMGSFVTNIHRPTDCYFNAGGKVTADDLLEPVREFSSSITVNGRRSRDASLQLHKIFRVSAQSHYDKDLFVESKKTSAYRVKNHAKIFERLMKQEGVTEWINEAGGEVYMLVSLMTTMDTKVKAGVGMVSSASAKGKLPIRFPEPTAQVGMDIRVEAGVEVSCQASRRGLRPGEVVMAAEYRLVKKRRFLIRSKCSLGGYPPGLMAFGFGDSDDDDDDEDVEIEEHRYVLEDDTVDGDIEIDFC